MDAVDTLPPSPILLSDGQAACFGLRAGTYPVSAADRAIVRTVHAQWVRFAHNSSPNGPGLPAWPGCGAERHGFADWLYRDYNIRALVGGR